MTVNPGPWLMIYVSRHRVFTEFTLLVHSAGLTQAWAFYGSGHQLMVRGPLVCVRPESWQLLFFRILWSAWLHSFPVVSLTRITGTWFWRFGEELEKPFLCR